MRKKKCIRFGKSAAFSETLIAVLVFAFAGQLAFAGVSNPTRVNPTPSRFLGRSILSTDSKAELYSFSLIPHRAEQAKVSENRNSKSNRGLRNKSVTRSKFGSGLRRVKSHKRAVIDCQACKDDCLTSSLECIGLSMLGGCGPCAAICLLEQVRCQLRCPCAAAFEENRN